MRLSAKPIVNFNNVNSMDYGNQWTIRANEPNRLYFQLIDLDKTDGSACKTPMRYIPQPVTPPATIEVLFPSIDDEDEITVAATQLAADGSIFYVDLTDGQTPASGNVIFKITIDGVIRSFGVLNMMSVEWPGSDGSC